MLLKRFSSGETVRRAPRIVLWGSFLVRMRFALRPVSSRTHTNSVSFSQRPGLWKTTSMTRSQPTCLKETIFPPTRYLWRSFCHGVFGGLPFSGEGRSAIALHSGWVLTRRASVFEAPKRSRLVSQSVGNVIFWTLVPVMSFSISWTSRRRARPSKVFIVPR